MSTSAVGIPSGSAGICASPARASCIVVAEPASANAAPAAPPTRKFLRPGFAGRSVFVVDMLSLLWLDCVARFPVLAHLLRSPGDELAPGT